MKNKLKILIFAALTAICLAFAGCSGGGALSEGDALNGLSVTDALGRNVTFAKKPIRIAVTSASFIEPLHDVGGITVIARPDSKTKMPDYAKDAASIGQVYEIDTERLLACQPDLVVINKGMNEKLLGILEENHIPAAVLATKTYADVKEQITLFAKITGREEIGRKFIADMDGKIAATAEKMPADKKRVVILHGTAQGLSIELPGSIAGNVVDMLGFTNVAAGMPSMDKKPDAAPYSLETLAAQNPDIIFVTSMGQIDDIKRAIGQMMGDNPAWQTIPAVREGKIFYLPQDMFLLSPGLHYPEAVAYMAKLVCPELFP